MKALFTPEDRARQARKLSDGINQVIRETVSAGLTENRRKLTAEQHAEMFGPDVPMPAPLADEIEPPVEPKQRRKAREVSRVLSILDELESEARP